MKTKRIISLLCIITLSLNFMVIPTIANDIMPRWDNIWSVYITHGLHEGKALCSVEIIGYSGTSKIDNVDMKLYRKSGDSLILVAQWDDLSAEGDYFYYYDEVDNVVGGYTYRLAVTADVHRYGYVEQLDTYGDVVY